MKSPPEVFRHGGQAVRCSVILVDIENRRASTDKQDKEVAVSKLFQDFVQVRRVLEAFRHRDHSLVIHRLALEDMIAFREADVPATIERAFLQRAGVRSTSRDSRRRNRWLEAVVFSASQILLFRVVYDSLSCRHRISHWELHGKPPVWFGNLLVLSHNSSNPKSLLS